MKSIVLLMTVITVCVIHTEARPRGAPSSTCSDFLPRHLANQATGPVPYVVNVSSIGASYSGGQTYPSKSHFLYKYNCACLILETSGILY